MAWLALESHVVFVLATALTATALPDVSTTATASGICHSLETVYADVRVQRPAGCSLITGFADVEGPPRSQAEHLFLRYSRLRVSKALTQPLMVYVGAADEDTLEVNHKKQCIYLSGVLKHIVRQDLATLLELDAARLQANQSSPIARTHLPFVARLRAESGRLVNHTMRVLSVLSNLSRAEVVQQAHELSKNTVRRMKSKRNKKPDIVQSHSIVVAYCSTLRSIEVALRDLIADICLSTI